MRDKHRMKLHAHILELEFSLPELPAMVCRSVEDCYL